MKDPDCGPMYEKWAEPSDFVVLFATCKARGIVGFFLSRCTLSLDSGFVMTYLLKKKDAGRGSNAHIKCKSSRSPA